MKKKIITTIALFSASILSLNSCNSIHYTVQLPQDEDLDECVTFLNPAQAAEFQTIYQNDSFVFSFKEETDVLSIYDKKNHYTWKTGIDMPNISESYCTAVPRDERPACYAANPVVEGAMTDTALAMANSLLSIEVYRETSSGATAYIYGSSMNQVTSNLYKVVGEEGHFKFIVDYSTNKNLQIDIKIRADLYFHEAGFDFSILDCNISGDQARLIKNILVAPFFGASGGILSTYDEESGKYVRTEKEMISGYVLVPDGAGAIIPFQNNVVADLSGYSSDIYGKDKAHQINNENYVSNVQTIKNANMPLYGIVHSDAQAAFLAYATRGEEYMSINMKPDNANQYQYNWAYPSFIYNYEYLQYYNQAGASFSTIASDRNHYSFTMRYQFLQNEDASYVGMAQAYKKYLQEQHILTPQERTDHIPVRLDFVMSDVEDSIVGDQNVVVTTVRDVDAILSDLSSSYQISSIVSSLLGWQSGGITTQRPYKAAFDSKIGSASEFKELFNKYSAMQYDLSFYQDYLRVNTAQLAFLNNVSKHINGYYIKEVNMDNPYITSNAYTRADRVYEYVVKQNKALSKKMDLSSMSVGGIGELLMSSSTTINRSEAKEYIKGAFSYLKEQNLKINAINPNQYVWPYVDRFFDCDVTDSSLLIEEQTVPFLQMVLQGSMEMYAKYSNFSFYDDVSILRMIDYQLFPSFVLTQESSYLLLNTNSSFYFSTEYSQYKELIGKIYQLVDAALKEVISANWINREVLDNQLVVNSYDNGKKIILNYSSQPQKYENKTIAALGYEVI